MQAKRRRQFLDYLDQLVQNPATLEKDVHKAFEKNLWVLGRNYSMMSSNVTLKKVIETYCNAKFSGSRAARRPDLLLSQDFGDRFLLIEFKRPTHDITRDDISQDEKYRDDLPVKFNSTARMDIMMIGKGRAVTIDTNNMARNITIHSYVSVISSARIKMDWLIDSLSD